MQGGWYCRDQFPQKLLVKSGCAASRDQSSVVEDHTIKPEPRKLGFYYRVRPRNEYADVNSCGQRCMCLVKHDRCGVSRHDAHHIRNVLYVQ